MWGVLIVLAELLAVRFCHACFYKPFCIDPFYYKDFLFGQSIITYYSDILVLIWTKYVLYPCCRMVVGPRVFNVVNPFVKRLLRFLIETCFGQNFLTMSQTWLDFWAWLLDQRYIVISDKSPYVYLAGLRKIGGTYYIKTTYDTWVVADKPFRAENGIDTITIGVNGIPRTVLNRFDGKNIGCSKTEWQSCFAYYNPDFQCCFYRNEKPSPSELLAFEVPRGQKSPFDHNPPIGAMEEPISINHWIQM